MHIRLTLLAYWDLSLGVDFKFHIFGSRIAKQQTCAKVISKKILKPFNKCLYILVSGWPNVSFHHSNSSQDNSVMNNLPIQGDVNEF